MVDKEFISKELKKFNITDAALAKLKEDFLVLKINNLEDKEGYNQVREARLTVKGLRVDVEKRRKDLKEDSLEYGRAIDREAKRIFKELEPIESYLKTQEDWVNSEKERIKKEAEEKENKRVQERINLLSQYNVPIDYKEIEKLSDQEFETILIGAKELYTKKQQLLEQERIAKEEAEKLRVEEQKKEEERLKIIKEEQAKEESRLKAIAEEQRLAQEKIDKEKAEIERQKKAAEQKIIKQQEEEALRIETQKFLSDKEKLLVLAKTIDNIVLPILASKQANKILLNIKNSLTEIVTTLKTKAKKV